jgi:putative DNA methylase
VSTPDHLRLIEDYLPIEAISAEASREKSVRKGHISTLHLWWARRPLVACRAAVYGALVSADRWVKEVELKNPPADPAKAEAFRNGAKRGLNRRAAAEFVTRLCKYPGDPKVIAQAQRHILEAHAERLTRETGKPVTVEDIEAGRAPRPKVLDMFAGGGAIPLEALRLGCEAYALDLNPVAHIIELCTLVYPQKYGQPDPSVRGMTGPPLSPLPPGEGMGVRANAEINPHPSPLPEGEGVAHSWGGLAAEVRYWGHWVLDRVRKQIGDLYPPIPDLEVWAEPPEIEFDRQTGGWKAIQEGKLKRGVKLEASAVARSLLSDDGDDDSDEEDGNQHAAAADMSLPPGFLQPVAYLWTRTVRCKNPGCAATVPLVRQTWLCKKKNRYVALKMIADKASRGRKPPESPRVRFEVVESDTEQGLGFDPAGFSKAGNATCPFCGTVADNDYVKAEGRAGRMGTQPMAVVCTRPGRKGKVYLAADDLPAHLLPDDAAIQKRITALCQRTGLTVPDEPIANLPADCYDNTLGITVRPYGLTTFGHLFTPRQMLCLLTFTAAVREAYQSMMGSASGLSQAGTGEPPVQTGSSQGTYDPDRAKAVATLLASMVDKITTRSNSVDGWDSGYEKIMQVFGRQAIPMVWDFAESNPLVEVGSGNFAEAIVGVHDAVASSAQVIQFANVIRGSATALQYPDASFDAVITDPPYYDNVPYADISDFFYVWLKRSIGHLYPEHFATAGTPKKQEAVADATRHGGDKQKAVRAYEAMMAQSLAEAHRVLKPGGTLVVVYAHKTTLGWSTLVEAFRRAGFTITEAWPLDTEGYRLRALNSAALASSIFLVGRKRIETAGVGNYEEQVQPELERIVRERVETLWEMGIAGADLVIACVGAGLRAFTKYERVEYANGEEVPAEKFLAEVEGVVLDSILQKLSKEAAGLSKSTQAGSLAGVDPATRFYVLWRYTYKNAELDAGEAIIFANGTHVELDGPAGLSTGTRALVEKKKGKYRLRDYTERGEDEKLGMPGEDGDSVPLIDALHRTLWLMERRPAQLGKFLREAEPNREQMRLVAQALAGPALKGGELADVSPSAELSALGKLTANWKSVIEDNVFSAEEQADRKRGQKKLFE